MSYNTIFTNTAIQNSNLTTKAITNFLAVSTNKINLNGNLGIGTNILFQRFHIDNLTFNMDIKISNENKIRSSTYNTYYALLPIGSIILFSSSTSTYYNSMVNNGWIECDGRTVSTSSYPLLEPLLQNSIYGNNGPYPQSSFKVPNFKDRIPIGAGGSIPASDINTNYELAMTIKQIPSHKHSFTLNSTLNYDYSRNHAHPGLKVPPSGSRDVNKSGGGNVAATRTTSISMSYAETFNHNHTVLLGTGDGLNNSPINLRHNVKYMIYMIKGR